MSTRRCRVAARQGRDDQGPRARSADWRTDQDRQEASRGRRAPAAARQTRHRTISAAERIRRGQEAFDDRRLPTPSSRSGRAQRLGPAPCKCVAFWHWRGRAVEPHAFVEGRINVAHARNVEEHIRLLREGDRMRGCNGLYQLVNGPMDPALLARYESGKWHKAWNGRATDRDIGTLRAIFLDCDPIRPKGYQRDRRSAARSMGGR